MRSGRLLGNARMRSCGSIAIAGALVLLGFGCPSPKQPSSSLPPVGVRPQVADALLHDQDVREDRSSRLHDAAAPAAFETGGASAGAPVETPREPGRQAVSEPGPGEARLITNFEGALQVPAGRSVQVRLSRPAERVAIGDPEVAEVVLISPYEVLINGKGRRESPEGGEASVREAQTSLVVWDRQGRSDMRTLYVNRSRIEQILLEVTVAEVNRTALEHYGVDFNFFEQGHLLFSTPAKIVSPGSTLSDMLPGARGLEGEFPLSTDRLTFLYRNFNEDFTVFLEALQRESLAKILARPVVLARSGEQAHFRVGGEVPIVYATSNVATVTFKEFGVLLTFTPEFTDDSKIDLRVVMEVSEPSTAFSTTLGGFEVPSFISRQAETRVLLEDGATLLIGGLYREQTSEREDKVPYLGDLPLLGWAFRRTVFDTSRSELVMAVRPRVAVDARALEVRSLPTDRPPLSRGELRTRQNPYGVTRPRVGRGPLPPPGPGWGTLDEYVGDESKESGD